MAVLSLSRKLERDRGLEFGRRHGCFVLCHVSLNGFSLLVAYVCTIDFLTHTYIVVSKTQKPCPAVTLLLPYEFLHSFTTEAEIFSKMQ